jgi:hypothetical protein
MLVKVKYSGFYPLGSDVRVNGVEIMKSKWHRYEKPTITYGKKNIASPFLQDLFYVVSKEKAVFFVAIELGLGHYHVFVASEKQNRRLSKKIDIEDVSYNPMAVRINKAGQAVRVYGRVVSGARDMNCKVDDSFFALIDTVVSDDYIRYVFTNNGSDRFYLDVYNPSMIDNAELFILIGKADKIIWHCEYAELGEIYQEYVFLDTYVKLTRQYEGKKETVYFH